MFFKNLNVQQLIWGTIASILILGIFIILAETDPTSLQTLCMEDGPIEYLTAFLFGLSSLAFFLTMKRSLFLRERKEWWRYFMILSWALLMFIFMGEEISWGQRIFNFRTPESISVSNEQNEFNIHNISVVNSFLGGKYRYLSIMIITIGILLPLLSLNIFGRQVIQNLFLPVSPICYMGFFIGSYVFGKYYHSFLGNSAAEIREFLMSVAMFLFALHGALYPWVLFRLYKPEHEIYSQ
jgi:hypothetical protein